DGVCLLGFVGAAIWMVIHFRRSQRWAALSVLWLSGTMLLYQNLNALYFFYPHRPSYINMHHVFWVLFGLMALYAAFARPRPVPAPEDPSPEAEPGFSWAGWLAGAVVILAIVVFLAGYVNGEQTMKTANTRWPAWSWQQGPFPGRAARP